MASAMRKKSSAHLYYQPLDFSLFTMVFIDFHSLLNLLCVLGCSRVLILFLFLTLFFHPIFLRDSLPPCLRGEYWVLVVAPPRCGKDFAVGFAFPITRASDSRSCAVDSRLNAVYIRHRG